MKLLNFNVLLGRRTIWYLGLRIKVLHPKMNEYVEIGSLQKSFFLYRDITTDMNDLSGTKLSFIGTHLVVIDGLVNPLLHFDHRKPHETH